MPLDFPSFRGRFNPLRGRNILAAGRRRALHETDEQPLRDELFSVDQLNRHAKELAAIECTAANKVGRNGRSPDRLLPRLTDNERVLEDGYAVVTSAVKKGRRITPAAEWFLDNYHLIQEQIRIARRDLPKGYSRELPRVGEGPNKGYPRVYVMAMELISHVDGRIDAETLRAFVTAYQSVSVLRLGELWAIPIMLRLALLENLRRIVVRLAAGRRERERATHWTDRMLEMAATTPAQVVMVLAEMIKENPPLSTAFVTEFATRAQGGGSALAFPNTWLEQRVAEQGQTIEGVFQQASQIQAADQVSVGNSIGSLRFLSAAEWRDFVEAMSSVEQTLRTDPAGVYSAMDFRTRDQYRHAVEETARASHRDEMEVARESIRMSVGRAAGSRKSHVGYYLVGAGKADLQTWAGIGSGLSRLFRRVGGARPLAFYAGSIAVVTVATTAIPIVIAGYGGVGCRWLIVWGLLLLFCMTQLSTALVNWAAMLLVRPRVLPRMNFGKGIPLDRRTIVVVPAMLTCDREVDDLVESLEVRFLANRDANLGFALLTDFPDATSESMPGDEALIDKVRHAIDGLNAKYAASVRQVVPTVRTAAGDPGDVSGSNQFFLFHRPRRWNALQNLWMGWERKRGKLEEFNEALRGKTGRFALIVGRTDWLPDIRYVITLDSDTHLPRGAARQLVGTMAHPLNHPHFDEKRGRVTRGYGILQPRVGIGIPSANLSEFARLFAGEPGIDPYTQAVSDVYQDLFDEGSFIGKGIYDVDAFQRAIGSRLPENRILSHDLIEGGYARSGLVSDVLLFENYPSSYPADISRRYRWIRGDWQIARWLFRKVPGANGRVRNPLSALSRWKILDNLRRSLMPTALLALLVTGWCLPGLALLATLTVFGILLVPAILNAGMELSSRPTERMLMHHVRTVAASIRRQIVQQGFMLACLPYDVLVTVKAISVTLYRTTISGRRLLEWRTASDAQRTASTRLSGFYASMWALPFASASIWIGLYFIRRSALVVADPVLVLWCIAPAIAYRLSRLSTPPKPRLSTDDLTFLALLSRRTWRFFETFVTPLDNHLPPDNFQEQAPGGIAHRTSPTNIGLALLANLAAHDFGYIPVSTVVERTSQTLATLDKLPRHQGHFYNWYDTRTLAPLLPLYVSTVDSGNLAGHLLTMAAGLDELCTQPVFNSAVYPGVAATLGLMLAAVTGIKADTFEWAKTSLTTSRGSLKDSNRLLRRIELAVEEVTKSFDASTDPDAVWWTDALRRQCRLWSDDLTRFAPWSDLPDRPDFVGLEELKRSLEQLDSATTFADIAATESSLLPVIDRSRAALATNPWLETFRNAVVASAELAAKQLADLRQLAVRCRELADIDYQFLYDRDRNLLSIGYSVTDRRLDPGFYDLLASEARLASYVGIAQEKLPGEHWFSLGRSLTSIGGRNALLSWSGSMFEYLMPLLVMPTYDNTLLDSTYHAVVKRQIAYGRERGVPWGISECGYTKTDAQGNYQYQAFGVPGLGFKRGLADDLVVAPYATAMALMVDPESACANLRRLAQSGLLHTYGFYEAVDFSSDRVRPGQDSEPVKSYMAHHQGMVFLSLVYLLRDKPMQRRFESDQAFRATDLLLQERVPKQTTIFPHRDEVAHPDRMSTLAPSNVRTFATARTAIPEVHLLSNSRYHVAITAAGGGYSRWRDLAVTRWREDATRDCWGTFVFLRDVDTGEFWSAGQQPALKVPTSYEAIFSQGRAELRRFDGEIETQLEISVSPEDDIELRRLTITNRGRTARTIEVTSYAEVVLASPASDSAHPAFSNLFVQTQIIRDRHAILCTRRPRGDNEQPPWMLHVMTVYGESCCPASFETSRERFIGRGRTPADPVAMHRKTLGNSEGAVLDPIVAIRNTVLVGPDQVVRVHLVTGAAETRDQAVALVERYRDRHFAARVFELAWTQSQVVLRQLDAAEADTQLFGRLASSILYANPAMRAGGSVISKNRRGQSGLWAYGISGDLPIVLLRIGDATKAGLIRQLLQAHAYWRTHGLAVDLVVWNEDQSVYRQTLQEQITEAVNARGEANLLDKRGGIFIRRVEQISDEDRLLIQTVARVIVCDSDGTLAEQMERRPTPQLPVPAFVPTHGKRTEYPAPTARPADPLALYNGIGGFTQDGREYVITTTAESPTPAPWVNVLANPWFGTIVSETGSAYTWCENAHSYRLTPWNNDPVSDVSGEAFYVRDEETGQFWSPFPMPARGPNPYTTRHGFGYTVFETAARGISTEMRVFVAIDAPLKFVMVKLRNTSGRSRRLSLTGYFDLVLGDLREIHGPHVVTELDPKTGALLARNAYNSEFADRVVFLDCSETKRMVTGNRGEFLGRNGNTSDPACLSNARLSGRVGAGIDPCAAMQVMFDLGDGQEREITFTFGTGRDLADTRNLVARFRGNAPARAALQTVHDFWNRTLGAVHVETPDASVNFLANGWLLYQVLASRIWGRSGFYQSGGAFGFRDQLQDSMSLVHAHPAVLREQILRCASRQFREGDVQHWWHPPQGRGVRTTISDDFLWLPFATCRYVTAIGDTGVLDENVQFLEARLLKPEEDSNYDLPARAAETGTLYEHCVRSIKHGLRFGEHGLPLMGSGDWNDGMNLVGEKGKGESVWLAFFLYDVLVKFAVLATTRHDQATATLCTTEAAKLRQNIEDHAWDGDWYKRAYFDNGDPLGSASNVECRIDSIPQSWSVLSGAAPPDRARRAMAEVDRQLVKRDIGIIQLFEPPFDNSDLDPGYIKGYVPGVRENGGQYTHAAIWTVMAFAAAGDCEKAWELFRLIDPVRHGGTAEAIAKYKVEPYVVAADVYANPQHTGRGGWTWYTGSAGWMYRLITESILGINLEVDQLRFSPCIPPGWTGFKLHYRFRETIYHIDVRTGANGKRVKAVLVDGVDQPDAVLHLTDDRREHTAEVELD